MIPGPPLGVGPLLPPLWIFPVLVEGRGDVSGSAQHTGIHSVLRKVRQVVGVWMREPLNSTYHYSLESPQTLIPMRLCDSLATWRHRPERHPLWLPIARLAYFSCVQNRGQKDTVPLCLR